MFQRIATRLRQSLACPNRETTLSASRPKTLAAFLFIALLTVFVLVGTALIGLQSDRYQQQQITDVTQTLNEISRALTSRIYSNIYHVSSVKAMVAMKPDLTQGDFSRAMEVQFREQMDLRNIGLARGMVLQFMHPIEGNEAAIGIDYTTLPDQIEAVELARQLNTVVLAGPLDLVQGGTGIIARIPIRIQQEETGQKTFWGFASVVMNLESMLANSGITDNHDSLRFAIRGRDGRGADGDVFFGEPHLFDREPVTQYVELPFGRWQIGATPTDGWSSYSLLADPLFWIHVAVAFAILGFTAIIVFLLGQYRQAAETLQTERDLFAEGPVVTLEWAPETEGQWPTRYASSNVRKILGYTSSEMLNPDLPYTSLIHPEDLESVIARLKRNIANHLDRFEDAYRLRSKPGDYLWVYDFTLLQRDSAGHLTGIRSYLYDQTARKRAEQALSIAEERLEKTAYDLTENIPVGTYTMVQPPQGGLAHFSFMSSRFLQLTGLQREEAAADPLRAFECVHPDDFDAWVALNTKTFEQKAPFFGEVRVVVQGETRWVTAESYPRSLPDGTTVWEGVLADITDRKRAEAALGESLQRFNDLVAYLSVGVYVFWHRADGRMEFEYVSDGWCEMNRVRREEALADASVAINNVHPDDMESFVQANQEAVRERKRFLWEGRMVIDGSIRFMLLESSPVFFDDGDSRWFGIEQDITERKRAEAELNATNLALAQEVAERRSVEQQLKIKTDLLEKLSMQDGLTGIPNRRHFDERSELEWKRTLRTGLPLALVMIDIDEFKRYNDHYGHGAGDDCLRLVAQALNHSCDRPLDLVARYGGEEFVALLPETSAEGAIHLAEQMRLAVNRLAIPHALSSAAQVVTLSAGVAAHEPGGEKTGLEQLRECADKALYAAKARGRNRVESEFTL